MSELGTVLEGAETTREVGSGQREAHQEYRRIEDPLKLADDRDAATFAR